MLRGHYQLTSALTLVERLNLMVRLTVGVALVVASAGSGNGQILIDDFTDGKDIGWSLFDYTEGESFGPATFDASSGAYHIGSEGGHTRTGGEALVAFWDDPTCDAQFDNGYLQARVRADNRDTVVAIALRGGTDEYGNPEGYLFSASANYGVLAVARQDATSFDFIGPMPSVGFGPGRDWIFQAGALDDRFEFKAWRADRNEPRSPQVVIRDRTYGSGQLGLAVIQSGGSPGRAFGATFDDIRFVPEPSTLQAGDADQDYDFDQFDLVRVQQSAKYLTGDPATWGEGDWNGAPGGTAGDPPAGDGAFNQFDIIAAQQTAIYMTGAYPAIQPAGPRAAQAPSDDVVDADYRWHAYKAAGRLVEGTGAFAGAQGFFEVDGYTRWFTDRGLGMAWESAPGQVYALVPEPSSVALLLLGALSIISSNWRRRRAA
jgi:hypothetical protein